MKCSKCNDEFNESELQLSHDIPKYMGGADADGRHYLCKKCHDIYEKLSFNIAIKTAYSYRPELQSIVKSEVKSFSKKYFGDD